MWFTIRLWIVTMAFKNKQFNCWLLHRPLSLLVCIILFLYEKKKLIMPTANAVQNNKTVTYKKLSGELVIIIGILVIEIKERVSDSIVCVCKGNKKCINIHRWFTSHKWLCHISKNNVIIMWIIRSKCIPGERTKAIKKHLIGKSFASSNYSTSLSILVIIANHWHIFDLSTKTHKHRNWNHKPKSKINGFQIKRSFRWMLNNVRIVFLWKKKNYYRFYFVRCRLSIELDNFDVISIVPWIILNALGIYDGSCARTRQSIGRFFVLISMASLALDWKIDLFVKLCNVHIWKWQFILKRWEREKRTPQTNLQFKWCYSLHSIYDHSR